VDQALGGGDDARARQPDDPMFEYACHEGNNSMRNILSASRAAEEAK